MNMAAGLLGYGAFTLTLTLVGMIGYWQADYLERFAKRIINKRKQSRQ